MGRGPKDLDAEGGEGAVRSTEALANSDHLGLVVSEVRQCGKRDLVGLGDGLLRKEDATDLTGGLDLLDEDSIEKGANAASDGLNMRKVGLCSRIENKSEERKEIRVE